MPKIRLGGDVALATLNGDDGFGSFATNDGGSTTEAEVQFTDYDGHVYEDIGGFVSLNGSSVAASFTFTDDGSPSSNLVASTTGTGFVEDTTGTESPAAGSLIGCDLTNAGMHGDSVTFDSAVVTASAGVAGLAAHRMTGTIDTFGGLWGYEQRGVFAEVTTRISRSVVYSNLRTHQRNSVTATISHYDGVASSNLTVSYSAESGVKEDTTGTESNVADDDVGFFFDRTSGTISGYAQLDSDVDEIPRGTNASRTWSTTTAYAPSITATAWATSETDGLSKDITRIGAEDIANLHVYVFSFTSATNPVLAVRINTTTSTNLTVAPSGTGLISDTTGTETLADGDFLGFIQTATAVSGVQTLTHYIEVPHTTVGPDTRAQTMRTGAVPYMRYLQGNQPAIGRTW